MTDIELTEEMRKDGWKPIEDIVNEPDDGIIQTASFRNKVFWIEGVDPCLFIKRAEITEKFPNNAPFYRRLAPVTSDITISRADATFLTKEEYVTPEDFKAFNTIRARLRAQLEGK